MFCNKKICKRILFIQSNLHCLIHSLKKSGSQLHGGGPFIVRWGKRKGDYGSLFVVKSKLTGFVHNIFHSFMFYSTQNNSFILVIFPFI